MAVDPSLAGRGYPPSAPYLVSREKIREFCDAIGETAAVCLDVDAARAAGHPDVVAPPTFPTVLTLRVVETVLADPELGLDWSRVVHGEERYSYARPVCAGDVLQVTTTIDSVRTVGGNAMVSLRAEVATAEGEDRVSARSMLVVRGDA